MEELNFPKYQFKGTLEGANPQIFDEVRKKYLKLTPEEWVRQHWIRFLNEELGYSMQLMQVECELRVNNMKFRFDLLLNNAVGNPQVLCEFKAPNIKIDQKVFNQAAKYNLDLKVPYLILSNGLQHFVAHCDFETKKVSLIKKLPTASELS